MQSAVSLIINARNLAGGVFQQLQNQAGAAASAMGKLFGGQKSGASGAGSAVSGLAAQYFLLNKAAEAATFAFTKLQQAGTEAIQRQVEQVSALSTAMQTLGLSQRDAGRYTQDVATKIAQLGKDLPTSSESIQVFFRTIQDDYNLALKGAGASLDTIKKAQLGSSARIALLSDLAGGDVGASRAAISAFLAGSVGAAGLNRYQFFANNPQLNNAIKSGLAAKGANSTGDLSALERVKLLTEALEKTVTPQMIDLLQGTVKARLSAFMDSLFDPTIGLFSIERDLEPKIDGYQSVFTAFGDTLDILIGNNGILENLTRLLGLQSVDPMRALFQGVTEINSWLLGISGQLATLKNLKISDAGASIGKLSAQIGNYLIGVLNSGVKFLGSLDWKEIFNGLFYGIGEFFKTLDYKQLFIEAPVVIFQALYSVVSGLVESLVDIGRTALHSLNDALGKKISEFVDGISSAVDDLFGGLLQKVTGAKPNNNVAPTTALPTQILGGAASAASFALNPFGVIANLAGGLFGSFFSRADGFIPASGGLISALASEMSRKPAGSDIAIANSSEYILTPAMMRNLTGNLLGGVGKTVNFQAGSIVFNLPSGTPQEIAMAALEILENAISRELETRIA